MGAVRNYCTTETSAYNVHSRTGNVWLKCVTEIHLRDVTRRWDHDTYFAELKVKVRFSLEQAMKSQSGGLGIPLLFL